MLSVEQRQEIAAQWETIARTIRNLQSSRHLGLDAQVELTVELQNARRLFYQNLDKCTDWGTDLAQTN